MDHRLGLFLHWGLYAINGRQEQEQQRCGVPAAEYRKLIDRFHPIRFDPGQWVQLALDCGFEYMVFTAKHHDGFCLWPSALTEFHVGNSPYGRDVAAMLAKACQEHHLPFEFYYSVVDWHHPMYPNIGRHHEITTDPARHDWEGYLAYLTGQIRELCTNYGKIHGIWWDMNVPEAVVPEIHQMIRTLQPAAVINNRGFGPGDYSTPERDWDPEGADANPVGAASAPRPVEACQSIGVNSWGWRRDEDYYSVRYFLTRIDETLAKGGNYLLNVGPDASGEIPPEAQRILQGVGAWYRKVRESFDAAYAPGTVAHPALRCTRRDQVLYVHVAAPLESSTLSLRPLEQAPRRVTLLNTGEPVDWTLEPVIYEANQGPALRLRGIDADGMAGTVPVFKLEFESSEAMESTQT